MVSFRGNLTKSSTSNVLPWGHCSPNPWTGCPEYLLCCYPWKALMTPEVLEPSLFYNPFSNSQPYFLLLWYLLLKGTYHLGTQLDNLALKSVHYRNRSFWSSRTTPWPHREAAKLIAAPRYERTCEQNYCTKLKMNTMLLKPCKSNSNSGAALSTRAS